MTAIVLPDIDRSTLAELRDRMPSLKLSEIELPSIERAGREADRAIDRILGRSRPPIWPWVAVGLGIAAIVGATFAMITWSRRPARPQPGESGLAAPAAEAAAVEEDLLVRLDTVGDGTDEVGFPMEGGRP